MKAAVYHGLEDMRIEHVPTPEPNEGELVIKVEACGICGSDARIYYRGHREVEPPQIIGHEIAGTVVAVGSEIQTYREGDRVNLTTEVTCGECSWCLRGRKNMCPHRKALGLFYAGGFAEYMLIPALAVRGGNVVKLPESVSFAEAALIEPLACCVNSQDYVRMGPGDHVAILGAGAMGCMLLALAKLCGAAQTILVNARSRERQQLARRIGADHYLTAADQNPVEAVLELTGGEGADVVLVAANSDVAQQEALAMAGKQGRVCFFAGLPAGTTEVALDTGRIHYSEISVLGAFSSTRHHADVALDLMASRKLDANLFITHRLPLDEVVHGIELKQSGESIKTVVLP